MAKDVKLIIASHWHNDHIKGIAKVYQDSLSADFVISDALKADEFGTLLQIDQSISAKKRALGELNQVLSTAYEKDNLIKLAISDRLIWSGSVDNQKCHVYCLSPSDASVQLARQEIAQIVNGFNSANRQIIDVNPNHNSVVLRIEIEDKNILLGSDLENTGDSNTGWSAVMRTNFKPMQNASVYKVPHHGSETSYAPEIWSSLLVPVPFAILTPFKQGKVRLPQKAYAEKISEHTEHAYITSDPNLKAKAKNRDYKVEKTIKQLGYSPVELSYPDGHIRLRSKINEQVWHLKLFGSAIHLKECNWQP